MARIFSIFFFVVFSRPLEGEQGIEPRFVNAC